MTDHQGITTAAQNLQDLKQQLSKTTQARNKAAARARNGAVALLPDMERKAIEAAEEALTQAKARYGLGLGTPQDVAAAEAALERTRGGIQAQKQEAAEEHGILTAQIDIIKKQVHAAEVALTQESANAMRPAVRKWLEALAALIEANDELHEAELAVVEAGGTPAVTAARELTVTAERSKARIPDLFTRSLGWAKHYAGDTAELLDDRTHLLKRESEEYAAKVVWAAEQRRKATARNEAALQRAADAAEKEQRGTRRRGLIGRLES